MRKAVVIGAGAALAGGAWYLLGAGRSLSTAVADLGGLVTGTIALDALQKRMVTLIGDEFERAGHGWLQHAAVANAYAESRLDPAAVSGFAGEDSVGLFQLNSAGAGVGMSTAQRQDPTLNTRRIIDEFEGPHGDPLRDARGTATNAELASLFAQFIERCWACGYGGGSGELVTRAALVSKLFGASVASTVPR